MLFTKVGESCYTALGILFFLKQLLKIAYIIIPIALIVMVSLDFFKGVINFGDDISKIFKLAMRRIVYAMFIFLIPSTVFALLNIVGITVKDSKSCWAYADEVSVKEVRMMQQVNHDLIEAEIEKLREEIASSFNIKDKSKELRTIISKPQSSTGESGDNSSSEGVTLGNKYQLTDEQLHAIAYACSLEQGTPKGAAAEASLIANKYEREKSKKSLYEYLRTNSRWFKDVTTRMAEAKYKKVSSKIKAAVKDVLVNGNRTLPLYVIEHDWFNDIEKIKVNGHTYTSRSDIRNRKNYIKDKTIIDNRMGGLYIFYTFPDPDNKECDPFGYEEAYKKKLEKLNK